MGNFDTLCLTKLAFVLVLIHKFCLIKQVKTVI